MIFPKFENPNPSAAWLSNENERLKQQAEKMLQQTKILGLFAKYGTVSDIGGSYSYDLMVYPDLDLGVIAKKVDDGLIASMTSDLIKHKSVRSVKVVDTYHFGHASKLDRPDGYWIGLEVPFENDRWGIDCWVQQPDWVKGDNNPTEDVYDTKLSILDKSAKDSILKLKYQLIFRGLYGKKYYSSDVYDAVLKHGPIGTEEFLSLDAK